MKKGIQKMNRFMQEQVTLGLTPSTASYYDLSHVSAALLATRGQLKARMTVGLWPPVLIAASDAHWRSGAVWGS